MNRNHAFVKRRSRFQTGPAHGGTPVSIRFALAPLQRPLCRSLSPLAHTANRAKPRCLSKAGPCEPSETSPQPSNSNSAALGKKSEIPPCTPAMPLNPIAFSNSRDKTRCPIQDKYFSIPTIRPSFQWAYEPFTKSRISTAVCQ